MNDDRKEWTPETVPDEFWDRIEAGHGDADQFAKVIAGLPPEELREMYWQYIDMSEWLLSEQHLEHMENPSDDQIMDLSNWIISRGRDFYYDIYEDPAKTPPAIPERERGNSFLSAIIFAYNDQTGKDIV